MKVAVRLKGADIITKKRETKKQKFANWAAANPTRQAKYGEVLANLPPPSPTIITEQSARDRVLRTYPNTGQHACFLPDL